MHGYFDHSPRDLGFGAVQYPGAVGQITDFDTKALRLVFVAGAHLPLGAISPASFQLSRHTRAAAAGFVLIGLLQRFPAVVLEQQ